MKLGLAPTIDRIFKVNYHIIVLMNIINLTFRFLKELIILSERF